MVTAACPLKLLSPGVPESAPANPDRTGAGHSPLNHTEREAGDRSHAIMGLDITVTFASRSSEDIPKGGLCCLEGKGRTYRFVKDCFSLHSFIC